MPLIVRLLILPLLLLCQAALASGPPDGFLPLFNGKDFSGWQGQKTIDPAKYAALPKEARKQRDAQDAADFAKHWLVEQGQIVNDGHGVFCSTVRDYGDFELLLDWKMVGPGTDSGIYLRGSPQVQIWDPNHKPQHKHGAHLGSGGLWNNNPGTPGKDPLVKADRPVGEWNTFRIKIVGDRVTIDLNDKRIVDNAVMHNYWDRKKPLAKRGPIQLQTHGGEMRFRNVFIKELPPTKSEKPVAYNRTIPGTKVAFQMLPIPGGQFTMGSPSSESDRADDEGPQIKVKVAPFWMGKCEVTWAEYHSYMAMEDVFQKFEDAKLRQVTKANKLDAVTAPSKLYEPTFTYESGDNPDQPAVSMSQYAAKQYTKWLSLLTGEFYRLPTEAEWEYACRAGTTTAYSFGDDPSKLSEYGWFTDNAEDYQTGKVGTKKPNAWGLHDMHGNACEWVLDQYQAGCYAQFAGKAVAARELFTKPTKLFPRVLRGGGWDMEADALRSAARLASDDEEWSMNDPNKPLSPWWLASDEGQMVGFRIVRPVDPPPRSLWNKYWDADLPWIQTVADRRIDEEGRGERGIVGPDLPQAIQKLRSQGEGK